MSEDVATGGFWQRHRIWVAAAVMVLLAAVLTAWADSRGPEYDAPLDPGNPGPEGARALARVLADQGVAVSVVRSADELDATTVDAATTVVVTGSDALAPSTTERLLDRVGTGRLVAVDPTHRFVDAFTDDDGPGPRVRVEPEEVAAGCPAHEDLRLTVDEAIGWREAEGCFTTGDATVLVETTGRAGSETVWFGAGAALTNDQVLRGDNAAIGLRLLGGSERLVWYVPSATDATADEAPGLGELIPDWIVPGLWLSLAAAIALVLWRVRRLGPLATEPLPVVVRAVETARSRGRMYHQSNDRAHAAGVLRAATRRRLARRLHLGPTADAAAVARAAHDRLGLDHDELHHLLDPDAPPPPTDEALVRLADALHRLDDEVTLR